MYPHAHSGGARGERLLRVLGGHQSVVRIGEREEDGITLRPELDTPSTLDGATDKAAVLGEELHVPVSERLDKPSGSLDVREEERDRAGRELRAHVRIIRGSRAASKAERSGGIPHTRAADGVDVAWLLRTIRSVAPDNVEDGHGIEIARMQQLLAERD
jgi:hypothetical protein